MRVEAYNQIMQVYGAQKLKKANAVKAAAYGKDAVEFSDRGIDLQTAKAAVAAASDVREELTAPLKEQIQNGTYEVSDESFADKLMAKLAEFA